MSHRRELVVCLVLVAILVAARSLPLMAPGVRFDADQAVVGLMAKHISEGRAFPLYFYGQNYLLAVEAYLAAPVMWLLGPTEVALKLPVLLMNVAMAGLLVWHGARGVGLRPWLAVVAALPLALPPIVIGTRLMEAMGGNIETPFYAVLLWTVRTRPWLFGTVTAVAVMHRELVVYPLAALALLDAVHARAHWRLALERWALALVLAATAFTTSQALRPFASMFGPGSVTRVVNDDFTAGRIVGAQLCLGPERWPSRLAAILWDHLPLAAGGLPGSLQVAGVSSGMGQGNPGLYPWVTALVAAGLVAAAWRGARGPASPAPGPPLPGGAPDTALPWFLILSGVLSLTVYTFVSCAQINANTLRYDLLIVCIPAGAVMAGLRHPAATVRAGLATAMLIWAWSSAGDYRALTTEIVAGRWPDHRGEAIRVLEARHLTTVWADYRLAYVLSFRSAERVTAAATESPRIDDYAARATAAHAPLVKSFPCASGEVLAEGVWLCPSPYPD